ncbi:hypothetical protein Mapa_005423 [Marchantia paleacea]|nr:hypothetical protein Mapa_005423 [Marchantia paleacea]
MERFARALAACAWTFSSTSRESKPASLSIALGKVAIRTLFSSAHANEVGESQSCLFQHTQGYVFGQQAYQSFKCSWKSCYSDLILIVPRQISYSSRSLYLHMLRCSSG